MVRAPAEERHGGHDEGQRPADCHVRACSGWPEDVGIARWVAHSTVPVDKRGSVSYDEDGEVDDNNINIAACFVDIAA